MPQPRLWRQRPPKRRRKSPRLKPSQPRLSGNGNNMTQIKNMCVLHVRSVRVVGLRTFAPMILKYQFIKIRSRHLYSRSRKKISVHIHTFDASSVWRFLYSFSQMFFVKFSSPFNFHPSILSSTIYIHSLVHHHNVSHAFRKFSYVSHLHLVILLFYLLWLPSLGFHFFARKSDKITNVLAIYPYVCVSFTCVSLSARRMNLFIATWFFLSLR